MMKQAFSKQEIEKYRQLFPVTHQWIYLNHAGVAPLHTHAAGAVQDFIRQALNQGYIAAPKWDHKIEEVRKQCALLIGAHADEIAFVKNTSHGLSLIARGLNLQAGDEVVLSEVEFPTNIYPWMALEKRGVILKKIPCRNGELDLQALPRIFNEKTKVVSLSSVQYGNGFRLPVGEIGRLCRERNIFFFLDAIQSLGAFPLDVHASSVDFLSADAHKWLLGPEGIGILYVRKELLDRIEPILLGWNSVSKAWDFDHIDFCLRNSAARFEEGSHNVMSIFALGACVDLLQEIGVERISQRILALTERLIHGLQNLNIHAQDQAKKINLTCSLDPDYRSGIVTFQFDALNESSKLESLERHLFSKHIYGAIRRGSLRFSPHFYNTEEEIDLTLEEIRKFLSSF